MQQSEGTAGVARLDRTTKRLTRRLQPGDIAVLDHLDLDGASARALVHRGVAAVVNAAPSTSGRYPNLGPKVLVEAGIPLLDDVGPDVFRQLRDGKVARLDGNVLWAGDRPVATGVLQDHDSVATAHEHAKAGLAAQVADLTSNATGFLLDERDLLLEGAGLPALSTPLEGRHVVVVAHGGHAADELAQLRGYLHEHRPVLIGVEGGAEVLLAAGLRPQVLVGDPLAMTDAALRSAGEVVVRAGSDGIPRLQDLGVTVVPFATLAGSEDMALLLAGHSEAALVVAVGMPATLVQLLDHGRAGAASSLLTRFGLGDRLVSARAAAVLVDRRFPWPAAVVLVVAGLGALVVAGAFAGSNGFDWQLLSTRWQQVLDQWPW
ncbi:MAG: thiamine pyrophosphokinae, catalytic region [Frankiales bacterium]|nr:thiamine pyrophosphokinae, catalytic region [Frankiales bacterium]